jgi:hypothetical protein
MLRRRAGNIHSQSCAICRHLGHIVQFTRTPNERLPARGFSAEYFPQFDGIRRHHGTVTCLAAAAQKSQCGRMRWAPQNRMPPLCLWFVATPPQAA